jgi:hypothetical protein
MSDTGGWEGHPVKDAIAEQEELIKRLASCEGIAGARHHWASYADEPGRHYQRCGVCGVTRTREDYAIKKGLDR